MKTFTIAEAIKEIDSNTDLNINKLTGIFYEDGSKLKFVADFGENRYFINLDDFTYKKIN